MSGEAGRGKGKKKGKYRWHHENRIDCAEKPYRILSCLNSVFPLLLVWLSLSFFQSSIYPFCLWWLLYAFLEGASYHILPRPYISLFLSHPGPPWTKTYLYIQYTSYPFPSSAPLFLFPLSLILYHPFLLLLALLFPLFWFLCPLSLLQYHVFWFFSFPQSPLSSPDMCHLCGPLLPLYTILFIQSGRCSMLWVFVIPWLSFLLCFLPWSSYIHSLYEYIASFLCSFYLFFFFCCNLLFPLSVYAPSHVTWLPVYFYWCYVWMPSLGAAKSTSFIPPVRLA